jgi:hypothetical protein
LYEEVMARWIVSPTAKLSTPGGPTAKLSTPGVARLPYRVEPGLLACGVTWAGQPVLCLGVTWAGQPGWLNCEGLEWALRG